MKSNKKSEKRISVLTNNPEFIEFLCYKEDKWLQNSSYQEKIYAFFGSLDNAEKEFQKDEIFNSKKY